MAFAVDPAPISRLTLDEPLDDRPSPDAGEVESTVYVQDSEAVMISTPLEKYEADVYELAEALSREIGLSYSKKKNRVIFPKDAVLLKRLGVEV